MDLPNHDRSDPLDTIDYLARSDHRSGVLDAIRDEPRTRAELRELVDASRVTVGRITTDLEERGWIERTGQTYEATSRGRYVATEFTRLVDNLAALEALPPVVDWFPGDEPSFELSRLEGARVVTATETDLIAPMRRALELIAGATRFRAVANGATMEFVEAMRDAVDAGADQMLVLPSETIEAIRTDPELAADVRAGIEAGLTLLEVDRGHLPIMQIADDTVALCSGDHEGMVETDDESVRDWASDYFETLRSAATAVPPERFAGEAPAVEGEAVVD